MLNKENNQTAESVSIEIKENQNSDNMSNSNISNISSMNININNNTSMNSSRYSSLSHSQMYTHILLMALQSKTDSIDADAVRYLIEEKGANPFLIDSEGNTFLHWAAWRSLNSIVHYLMVEHKVQAYTKNDLQQTCLHWACMGGDISSVKKFIDIGLSVVQPDIDGYTSLHAAAQFNQAGILEFCKFYTNINLDFKDRKGRTPLHWAVYKEHTLVIEWLLANGANACVQDIYGETAMHIAAKKNKFRALSTLIKFEYNGGSHSGSSNANESDFICLKIKNKQNKTCLELAVDNENTESMKLLKQIISRQNNIWWQFFDGWTDGKYSMPSMKRFGVFACTYFMVMQALVFLIDIFFYVPAYNDRFSMVLHVISWILCFSGYVCWWIVHNSDPGTIHKPSAEEVGQMFIIHNNYITSENNISDMVNANGNKREIVSENELKIEIESEKDINDEIKESETEIIDHQNTNIDKKTKECKNDDYISHLLAGNSAKICITCRVVKPLRSKHCSVCNRCVKKFDHHWYAFIFHILYKLIHLRCCLNIFYSPWVNNCIGEGNYKQFLWYLLVETFGMIYFTALTIIYYASGHWTILGICISLPINTMMLGLILFNVLQIYSHVLLITYGWTTNEQHNMLRYLYFRDARGNVRNPFGHGCIKNWLQFCMCNQGIFGMNIKYPMIDIQEAPVIAKVKNGEAEEKETEHKCENNCEKK